ncbi:divalent metal ion transporter SMF2 KNAG_0B04920 [Huiozyma naganishii CBS 8797]|uniref:Uncharacterized protein n=1 Tax=Huiozyma naganishii (strain ATCC MYA-139 / BCRC 22969 / CBS 8797 / KCTC 17520 / NBRC 10181 / NCYC 3082 / Yp74L-3) TaxID=1071383 RepID=J7S517_HUIN7|nr:hypothetical protein KNAG_0B04920 [Kazachstania naganishii CBS 8797]CCK68926.1 hypothetical protein KNAG_0B04920 [Kazachstania naganishii CBS 8797]
MGGKYKELPVHEAEELLRGGLPLGDSEPSEVLDGESLRVEQAERESGMMVFQALRKYGKFVGPGLMASVSYMDPGNYSTAVAAGSAHKYKLLFSILVSNFMAAFWQSLCAKLGAVTGLDLAQNCKRHLPHGLNITLYILAEVAIVATDLAEVVGTAISLNILFGVPLALGVVLTVVDVLIVLMAYKPNGSMRLIRLFEMFVSVLVVLTVICFAVELCYADLGPAREIFTGFLPSRAVFEGDGLYLSLAILGATVMPHSLYLGSGVVQPRLRDYDIKRGYYTPDEQDAENNHDNYRPSFEAINETLNYTVAELLISLFTVALFVNCAILIVSGATLYGTTQDSGEADLFSIYNLLCSTLSKSAGIVFVLALLFSGQSAGIVCTLSGQMVSEGFLDWTVPPAIRRSLTRAVAITPCLILVLVAGRNGLSGALNASQVVLSLLLPFVSAPLIYFTSNKEVMRVQTNHHNNCQQPPRRSTARKSLDGDDENSFPLEDMTLTSSSSQVPHAPLQQEQEIAARDVSGDTALAEYKDMSNGTVTTVAAVLVWLLVSALNMYMLISFARGQDVHF